MNVYGWIFVLPLILLVIFDPLEMIPALAFFVVWLVVWLVIFNKMFGKKD